MRAHAKSKRRTWRKLHLAVERQSGEIQSAGLTEAGISDDTMAQVMLVQIKKPIDSLAADGSYEKCRVYKSLGQNTPYAKVLIPLRRNPRIWQHGSSKTEGFKRDEHLRHIRKHRCTAWKSVSGYYARSLVKTAMFTTKPSLLANFQRI